MSLLTQRIQSACISAAIAGAAFLAGTSQAHAAPLNISQVPLFLQDGVAPLNMLVMGRDHKLYYEAYNDRSDLDGDGDLDIGYLPAQIDYFGYFDSQKCYTHDGTRFAPARTTTDKTCGGAGEWSGDWLNYVTTSRIDALRKVLYGGTRSSDSDSLTVLQRSVIPQDAHSWGKEYTSVLADGYDIRDYTPYTAPASGNRHLFANTTLMTTADWTTNTGSPRMLVLLNRPYRIWHWISKESPVAGFSVNPGTGSLAVTHDANLRVRVEVCVDGLLESNCRRYPDGNYKPTGLLQDFGENDTMLFGLLTGSYAKSKSGGVLRKDVGSIQNEINVDSDGTLTSTVGIIRTLDRLRPAGYRSYTSEAGGFGVYYPPGLVTTRPFNEGEFGGMWGNPIAEMMYETLRYFAGKTGPTSVFDYSSGIDSTAPLSLSKVNSWTNPYRTSQPSCAKPFQTVMSDVNASYDTDQLPGSYFGSFSGDLTGLNVSTIADQIWNAEVGASGRYYIGQSQSTYDGAPTPKTISSFSNIRGLAPEEPTKEGGYYAGSVAHFGIANDINTTRTGRQNVQTFVVALASPLPRIEIPIGSGRVTLVPFAKSVGGCAGVNGAEGVFQPTNQIVDFYVESLTPTSGTFQVNFEDVESGNDHDMDAIVRYSYVVAGDTVTVTLSSDYAAGCIIQHMGYVISGTTADGTYLEVRDVDTLAGSDVDYFLDTPNATGDLPLVASRVFTAGATPGASILKDPLWYAAKWGGFKDNNNSNTPDLTTEWDSDNDGEPDNYFLVTNALTLGQQLTKAFDEILERVASASSASVNSGSISSETRVYQAKFNSGSWAGQLLSYPVNDDGTLGNPEWDAAQKIPLANEREIVTVNSDGTPVPFRWDELDATRKAQIDPAYADSTADEQRAEDRLNYLRGSAVDEEQNGGAFRDRPSRLGDIVASAPIFVGAPSFSHPDSLEDEPAEAYSKFRADNGDRQQIVYVGANDGMVHAFDAEDGDEVFAFIPSAAMRNIRSLSDPAYSHKFFVDAPPNSGDVLINNEWETVVVGGLSSGGQEIYALKATDPATFTEASAASVVMWEFTDSDADGATNGITGDADLGYTYSQPAIVRLQNGKWGAIFGNGYNNTQSDSSVSASGNAVLYVVDIEDGAVIRKFDTGVGTADDPLGSGRPNGLSTPAVVDLNGDSKVDFVFAGDLFGNMWKFDIRNADKDNWGFAFGDDADPVPFYTAVDPTDDTLRQPITSRPEVIRGPRGVGMMVLFGTGKYFEVNDKIVNTGSPEVQTYYGLFDRNTGSDSDRIEDLATLLEQEIQSEQTATFGTRSVRVRTTTQHPLGSSDGWYMNLLSPNGYQGERQVSNTAVRGGRVVFTTLIPDSSPCNFGGSSWLMELDARTGGRLIQPPFDIDGDGEITGADQLNGQSVSGMQLDVGITPEPGILLAPGGDKEFKYNPGTTGDISVTVESRPPNSFGRQSWRQVR